MSLTATIFDISKTALHDGPGIRSTVYFKGCNLSCLWCHNPESHSAKPEISFAAQKCIQCGTCSAICPEHHIAAKGGLTFIALAAVSAEPVLTTVTQKHLQWWENNIRPNRFSRRFCGIKLTISAPVAVLPYPVANVCSIRSLPPECCAFVRKTASIR